MKRAYLAVLILIASFLVIGAQAQTQAPDQDVAYPSNDQSGRQSAPAPPSQPAQGVARVSLIHGDVSMLRGDSGEWVATTLNTPISQGNWVATGDKSRAEIQLDFANILRLSASSEAKVAELTHSRIQIQMASGYAGFTQFKGNEADVEIDTPNVAVHLLKHGRYRVQVNSEAETDVIVREGEADIATPQGSTHLREGEMITIRGTDNPEYKVSRAPGKDDWDRWNKDRDHLIQDAEGYRHTNRYYTGAQDLDAYGHWVYVPGYGNVWAPYNTDASWAPYQAGRWVWEPYYGWTWVSYEPWGWAPYHYGRWFFYGASWYWWPGPIHAYYRPVWAPAFVVFLGFGHHGGFGFGSIGWLPCGPHDYFYPWYGRGFNHVNVTNITNITNVTNIRNGGGGVAPLAGHTLPAMSNVNQAMTNARVRNAIATVRTEDFGRGVHQRGAGSVGVMDLKQAQAVTGNLPVVPGRESLRSTDRPAAVTPADRGGANERFFSRHAPPAAEPSFQQQQNQVQEVMRAHGGPAQNTAPVGRGGGPAGVMTPAPSTRGGGPTGVMTPAPAQGSGAPALPAAKPPVADQSRQEHNQRGGRDGWRTFGSPRGQPGPSAVPAPNVPAPPSGGRQGGPAGVMTPAPPSAGRQENTAPRSLPQTPPTQRNDRVAPPPPPSSGRAAEAPRPQVDLNRPIVTPRPPETLQRNTAPAPPARIERSTPPPPAPAPRVERNSTPPPRIERNSAPRVERSSPPPSRVERSAPAPRSSGGNSGGGHSSSGGDKHSSSGSSDKGSHDHNHR